MNQTIDHLQEIKLIGITCRTNNKQLFEADIETNKVASLVHHYVHTQVFDKIPHRKNPGTTYCVYTQYESNEHGDFTYFIGETVDSFDNLPEGLETLTIPAQKYAKFTDGPSKMPEVCIGIWQHIWGLNPQDFGGERGYIADFELYDERSYDHNNATLDIYIGIK